MTTVGLGDLVAGGTGKALLEIVSKAMTILSSEGGLTWLLNHVRNNEDFKKKLSESIAALPRPEPPKEG